MDYNIINLLIEDIENILDSIFMCGLRAAPRNISVNCSNVAAECKKYGLEFAGERLISIAAAIDQRRHSVEYSFNDVVNEVCVLGCYINVLKSKVHLESIKAHL